MGRTHGSIPWTVVDSTTGRASFHVATETPQQAGSNPIPIHIFINFHICGGFIFSEGVGAFDWRIVWLVGGVRWFG